MDCYNCNIATLNVAALTLLVRLYCFSNSMDEANVDNVLADLVTAGANNGVLGIGGTNAAPSVPGGTDDVAILVGRGWTVSTS